MNQPANLDLLLVTALTEEQQIVLSLLGRVASCLGVYGSLPELNRTTLYELSTDKGSYLIGSVCAHEMGALRMSVYLSRFLATGVRPATAVLVGFAATANHEEAQLGDVPIASEVIAYDDVEIDAEKMGFRPRGYQVDRELIDAAGALRENVVAYKRWQTACLEILPGVIEAIRPTRRIDISIPANLPPPHLVVGRGAGGPFLVRDEHFMRGLRKGNDGMTRLHSKLAWVEMESHGFMQAASEFRVPGIVIKGISDCGDAAKTQTERDTGGFYRIYASVNAAMALIEVLKQHPRYPIPYDQRLSSAPAVPRATAIGIEQPASEGEGADDDRGYESAGLPQYSDSSPPASAVVRRDNMLDSIDGMFEGACRIVVVRADEGYGKTTLLQQLARRHTINTLSLFIEGASRWDYNPGLVAAEVHKQIAGLVPGYEIPTQSVLDAGSLSAGIQALKRRLESKIPYFYFLVDGLEEIPKEDQEMRRAIEEMLPFGLRGIRFVMTSDAPSRVPPKYVREFPLAAFTLGESTAFLAGLGLTSPQSEGFYRSCRGVPGRIAAVVRVLRTGLSPDDLLQNLDSKMPDIFRVEWYPVYDFGSEVLDALALLAFERRVHTVQTLASVVSCDVSSISEALSRLSFLVQNERGGLSFVSESFRRFAQAQLASRRTRVRQLALDALLRAPDTDEAVAHLPEYLDEAGRTEELLHVLSGAHFEAVIERQSSLAGVHQKIEIGLRAAQKARKDGEVIRLGLQRAVSLSMITGEVLRSEVRARLALGELARARALANSARLKEDRLELLAAIVAHQRSMTGAVDSELIDAVENLHETINPSVLGNRALTVAADLLASRPQLALSLVESVSRTGQGASGSIDTALASLVLRAAKDADQTLAKESARQISQKIVNPHMREATERLFVLVAESSAAEVLAVAQQIEAADDRLSLIRFWISRNRTRRDVGTVIDFAIRCALTATEHVSTARTFADLAMPLADLEDIEHSRRLVALLDAQRGAADRLGPTQDYVAFCLSLARAESRYDPGAGRERLLDMYFYVSEVRDVATRLACMSELLAALGVVDPSKVLETSDSLHSLCESEWRVLREEVLGATAQHEDIGRPVIRALSRMRPDLAKEFALSLNTEERRDDALLGLVRATSDNARRGHPGSIEAVEAAIDAIRDPAIGDEARERFLERLLKAKPPMLARVEVWNASLRTWRAIKPLSARARMGAWLYAEGRRAGTVNGEELADLFAHVWTCWLALDAVHDKVDVGFRAVEWLAEPEPAAARRFLEETESVLLSSIFGADGVADGFDGALNLCIRLYAGLLNRRVDTEADLARLAGLVERYPSRAGRARLWSDVAVRMHLSGRGEDAQRLVRERIRPLLEALEGEDQAEAHRTSVMCAPALYIGHRGLAFERLERIPGQQRDSALEAIAYLLLRGVDPWEPYDAVGTAGYETDYETIVDVVEVLSRVESDHVIYGIVEDIVNSVSSNRARDIIKATQKSDVARLLEAQVRKKLPNPRFIRHDGFLLLALAQIRRLVPTNQAEWDGVIAGIRRVPNVSDRVFMLVAVAGFVGKCSSEPRGILREARELAQKIPSLGDRAIRLKEVAREAMRVDRELGRACLRDAMTIATPLSGAEGWRVRRSITDVAYRADPDFAATLAAVNDRDPATRRAKLEHEERLALLQRRDALLGEKESTWDQTEIQRASSAAWMTLGAIHSRRQAALKREDVHRLLVCAAGTAISTTFPLFAVAVESMVLQYSRQEGARTMLRPMFDGACEAIDATLRLATRMGLSGREARGLDGRDDLPMSRYETSVGHRLLSEWMYETGRESIVICDAWFSPYSLESIVELRRSGATGRVRVLTGRREHLALEGGPEEAYLRRLEAELADEPLRPCEIIIVGTSGGGESPVRERLWLSAKGGLRWDSGASGSSGMSLDFVQRLAPIEAQEWMRVLAGYLEKRVEEHHGERLRYLSFTL